MADFSRWCLTNTITLQGEATVAEALGSFWELADLIPDTKGKVKLVIYIDEAHTLASKTRAGASMYDHMLKATAEFATVGVFFLFLSTASRLEVLASQSALSASARFQLAHDSLVAPFTEMPFDCHPSLVKEPIQPGLKLEDIRKFSFAARFGRPLSVTFALFHINVAYFRKGFGPTSKLWSSVIRARQKRIHQLWEWRRRNLSRIHLRPYQK